MTSRPYRRIAAGLAIGVVVGALGPMLNAVAWHSGNGSGNSVVAVRSAPVLEQRATAAWAGGYSFEITTWTLADASVAEEQGSASTSGVAEVVARGLACDETSCEPSRVWRGRFVLPADPTQTRVVMDPLALTATFGGTLVEEATGEPCRFDVGWTVRMPEDIDSRSDASVTDREHAQAAVHADLQREEVNASVNAPECWPTSSSSGFGEGIGMRSSRITLTGELGRAHLCVAVPSRGLVCPLD